MHVVNGLAKVLCKATEIENPPPFENTDMALRLLCNFSLVFKPRVRRQDQIFLLGTPGAGKSTILGLFKSVCGSRMFTPCGEATVAFSIDAFLGREKGIYLQDEVDCKTVAIFQPFHLNAILEGHLDTLVSKKHMVGILQQVCILA